jgi:hypothetical protein
VQASINPPNSRPARIPACAGMTFEGVSHRPRHSTAVIPRLACPGEGRGSRGPIAQQCGSHRNATAPPIPSSRRRPGPAQASINPPNSNLARIPASAGMTFEGVPPPAPPHRCHPRSCLPRCRPGTRRPIAQLGRSPRSAPAPSTPSSRRRPGTVQVSLMLSLCHEEALRLHPRQPPSRHILRRRDERFGA